MNPRAPSKHVYCVRPINSWPGLRGVARLGSRPLDVRMCDVWFERTCLLAALSKKYMPTTAGYSRGLLSNIARVYMYILPECIRSQIAIARHISNSPFPSTRVCVCALPDLRAECHIAAIQAHHVPYVTQCYWSRLHAVARTALCGTVYIFATDCCRRAIHVVMFSHRIPYWQSSESVIIIPRSVAIPWGCWSSLVIPCSGRYKVNRSEQESARGLGRNGIAGDG